MSHVTLKRWIIFATEAWVELAFLKAHTYNLSAAGAEFRRGMPISEPYVAANHRLENETYFKQALYSSPLRCNLDNLLSKRLNFR